jgi:uncharacterized protein YbjT (DUF2867 family)
MILVTGATGNIGGPLVQMLLASKQQVRVLTRDRARVTASGVEIVVGDLEQPATLAPALAGVERAFFVFHAGPQLAARAGEFAQAARAAGVKHVVAVSSGTIEMTPLPLIGRWHAELEEAFAGLATTFLRPDNFASNALRWAPFIKQGSMVFAPYADGQSTPIDPYDIAAVAHVALTAPGHEGKVYTLSGPAVMTTREQVGVIAAELGREIKVVDASPDQARAGMVRSGMPEQMASAILELLNRTPRPTKTVREVTGVEPRSFATWVHDHRAAFV